MKVSDVDNLLTDFAEEFGVPKPNYCIYKVETVKKPDPWRTPLGGGVLTLKIRGMRDPIPYGGCFISEKRGKLCYITLLLKGSRGVSRYNLIHEFFHYLRYVRNGYRVSEDQEEEERWVKSQTRKYSKKLRGE